MPNEKKGAPIFWLNLKVSPEQIKPRYSRQSRPQQQTGQQSNQQQLVQQQTQTIQHKNNSIYLSDIDTLDIATDDLPF